MRLPRMTLAAAVVSLALLTGCASTADSAQEPLVQTDVSLPPTPSATPEPSSSAEPEANDQPILSTAGFGDIKLGAPVPDGLDYATWVPDYCGQTGAFAKAGSTLQDGFDFVIGNGEVDSPDADVSGIFVFGKGVRTPSGVHVGQSLERVQALLPQLEEVVTGGGPSQLYVVKDNLGQLVFEFAEGELKVMTSLANSREPFALWYSDAGSPCAA